MTNFHDTEAIFREVSAAFARQDIDAATELFAEDAVVVEATERASR